MKLSDLSPQTSHPWPNLLKTFPKEGQQLILQVRVTSGFFPEFPIMHVSNMWQRYPNFWFIWTMMLRYSSHTIDTTGEHILQIKENGEKIISRWLFSFTFGEEEGDFWVWWPLDCWWTWPKVGFTAETFVYGEREGVMVEEEDAFLCACHLLEVVHLKRIGFNVRLPL